MAACIADAGYSVLGFDSDPRVSDRLRSDVSLPDEPEVARLLHQNHDHFRVAANVEELKGCAITFVVVPTPSESSGGFTPEYVAGAAEALGAWWRGSAEYRLVVIVSTLMPGTTERAIIRALERASGRRCGETFGVCYSPAFAALGRVVHDLRNPEFILIGESDVRAGDMLQEFYNGFHGHPPPLVRMNLVNAEIAKLSVNAFVTMKISFANLIGELAERTPGADAIAITRAMGHDSRIGPRFLRPGTAFGGPCFPRDNRAFSNWAATVGVDAPLPEAADAINERQTQRLLGLLLPLVAPGARIAVLGLAYRVGIDILDASAGTAMTKVLVRSGYSVHVHEPTGEVRARSMFGETVTYAPSVEHAIERADAVIVALPHPDFERVNSVVSRPRAGTLPILLDCWGMFDEASLAGRYRYRRPGRS